VYLSHALSLSLFRFRARGVCHMTHMYPPPRSFAFARAFSLAQLLMRLRAEAASQDAGKGSGEGNGEGGEEGEAAQRVRAWGSNLSYMYKLAGSMVTVCVYTYVHVYTRMYMYIHVCTCVYTYVHVYVSTYVNVYVYVCISSFLPPPTHTLCLLPQHTHPVSQEELEKMIAAAGGRRIDPDSLSDDKRALLMMYISSLETWQVSFGYVLGLFWLFIWSLLVFPAWRRGRSRARSRSRSRCLSPPLSLSLTFSHTSLSYTHIRTR